MPHLGTQPPTGFKTTTKQSFSGDNSTTAFTLNRASSSETDLEVFVDNIQQEPTTAYSVSGTTLTFTEAPPTGTNNVYVVNRGGDQNGLLPPQDLGTTDYIFGDDISFNSDGAVINFGADSDINLTHVADTGLNLKNANTGDDNPMVLTLQTGDTDIAADDILGTINFQAPDEGTGTDAILVAAGIEAVSEGDFSSSSNATKLVFKTGSSEAAAAKMNLTSSGKLEVLSGGIDVEGGAVFNEDSADVDFRVESNGEANMLFVDGGNDRVGIGTTGGSGETLTVTKSGADATVRINGVASQEAALKLQGNNTITNTFKIASEEDDSGLTIQKWNGSAYVTHIASSANGEVTKPQQPAFYAVNTNSNNNIATNNTEITIEFDTERFDVNSDFNTSTFLFTAPVTGKYQLNVSLNISQLDTAATQYTIRINTSNRNYLLAIDPEFSSDTLFPFSISTLADMDANDTAKVTLAQNGGTAQTDVRDDPGSHFSGYLVA